MNTTYAQKKAPAQKMDANTAASVVDNSSQGETLQRKADMAKGKNIQGVVQKTNEDVDQSEKREFDTDLAKVKQKVNFEKTKMSKGLFHKKFIFLYMDENEKDKETLKKSVTNWFEKMNKVIPNGLEVYVSNEFMQQRSFNYGHGIICLKSKSMENLMNDMFPPIAKKIADNTDNKLEKFAEVTLKHELGHILHRQCCENFYKYKDRSRALSTWNVLDQNDVRNICNDVSGYSLSGYSLMGSAAEFVAEVFAGLSSGMSYNEKIINAYKRLGGPLQESLVELGGMYAFRENYA